MPGSVSASQRPTNAMCLQITQPWKTLPLPHKDQSVIVFSPGGRTELLSLGEWTELNNSHLTTVHETTKVIGDRGNPVDTTSMRPSRSTSSEVSHVTTMSPSCAAMIRARRFSHSWHYPRKKA